MPTQVSPGRVEVSPGERVRIPDETAWVQFKHSLGDRQHEDLGAWFAMHPQASLRVYGNDTGSITDLEFLRRYPRLAGFAIDSMHGATPSLAGLRHLPDGLGHLRVGIPVGAEGEELLGRLPSLRYVGISQNKTLPAALSGCASARTVYVEGPVKNLDALRSLAGVDDLTLRSVTVPNLEPLLGMQRLRSLDIKLGGIRDLGFVPRFPNLSYLELWMIRGLADLSFLGQVTSLKHLRLEALRNVTVLPSFEGLGALRTVELHTMKGLTDLAPVAAAPALETLWLVDVSHLQPEVVRPFVGHPTLKKARLGFGSQRKNEAARGLLNLAEQ